MPNNSIITELKQAMTHDSYSVSRKDLDWVADLMHSSNVVERCAITMALEILGFKAFMRDNHFYILSNEELAKLKELREQEVKR